MWLICMIACSVHVNQVPVSTCANESSTELWAYAIVLWCRPPPHCRPRAAAWTYHVLNGDVLALLECRIYHQTMTKNRLHLLLCSRLSGLLSRPVETRGALRRSLKNLECVSMPLYRPWHPCLCTCAQTRMPGTTINILTDCKPSELVGECIFYAHQVRTQTI